MKKRRTGQSALLFVVLTMLVGGCFRQRHAGCGDEEGKDEVGFWE